MKRTPKMATAYLETLNPEQRRAVEHGAAARSASQGPKVDIGARMRGMWR